MGANKPKDPLLDWSAYQDAGMGDAYADIPKFGGNFAKAVAVCINSGQCETHNRLLMCPSFKVSDDADLSTGGRVRLLKEALARADWEDAFADPRLARTMALCVSCKGCKRECDNAVDMALIKAEYQAWKKRREGLSWRDRLFANTPKWLSQWPQLRSLIAWRNRSGLLRQLTQKRLQVAADAPLPVPAKQPFSDALNRDSITPTSSRQAPVGEVVLLVDTFTRHFEPGIPQAAMTVLRAAGYEVIEARPPADDCEPSRPLCCGRTYLAQGCVEEARTEAQRLVESLLPHIDAGRQIVGLEASCVLGLRDDAKALGLGEALERLQGHVLLFEEFIAREIMAKRFKVAFKPLPEGETLIHGHCHQKAVGAMKAVRRVLKLIPDHQFSLIESGCCGMAGTFGLEAEHREVSVAMANKELMPALEDKPQARVLANGFSCRHQMKSLGDQRAQHLAQLLADLLPENAREPASSPHLNDLLPI